MGQILVGTASWTDRTLIASGWYPPEADTPEKRLRFYARQFPLVEVDATYYALPAEQTARSWAERTPAGFTFNVKAFSLFTQHPTPVKALPADLREEAAKTGKDRVYLKDVDPAVADQAWDRFLAALEPLRQAGKLGVILLQFPPWFPISRSRKDYILACAQRAAPDRVCIEFRNRTWMTPDNQEETLGFLASHRLPYVCVDMPQGYPSSIPPVLAATSDLALVRMHGHSDKWDSKDIYERFGYRYSDGELAEWAPRIRGLADDADITHVLFNNCYRNYAQVNAQQLAADLHGNDDERPGTLPASGYLRGAEHLRGLTRARSCKKVWHMQMEQPRTDLPPALGIARAWQTTVFLGVITLILGLIVAFRPSTSLNVIAVLIGLLMIISGIFHLIRVFDSAESHRIWLGIAGLLLIVIGVVLIRHLHLTVALIGLIVGITWIVQGISALVTGITSGPFEGRGWWIFFGIVSLIAGIVVTAVPTTSITTIAVLVGIWFIVIGLFEIIGGFMIRHAINKAETTMLDPPRAGEGAAAL